jgi:hypothetical protein
VRVVGKIFVSAVVFIGIFLFSFWLVFVQIVPEGMDGLATGAALLTALIAATLTWAGMNARAGGILTTMMTWGAISGAIGFCGGFFGPMMFAPAANQGPLLGIFITGPAGFVAGIVGGLIYGTRRRAHTGLV